MNKYNILYKYSSILIVVGAIGVLLIFYFNNIPIKIKSDQEMRDENRIHNMYLEKENIDKGAIKLDLEIKIENENSNSTKYRLEQLYTIAIGRNNNIYAYDTKQCKIFVFNINGMLLNTFGRQGKGPGEFSIPMDIFCDNIGNVYVNDPGNGRIDVFDENGNYKKSFKIYKFYKNMTMDDSGMIYANYISNNYDENLIEIINDRGELIRSFGKRLTSRDNIKIFNEVFIATANNKYIFVLSKYFNIFRKYSIDGKLLLEKKINNDNINNISEKNIIDMVPKDGSVRGRELFSGMCYYDGSIFIIKTYPRIEIFKCDEDANIKNIHWHDIQYNYIGSNIIVTNISGKRNYITLQKYPDSSVIVYSSEIQK